MLNHIRINLNTEIIVGQISLCAIPIGGWWNATAAPASEQADVHDAKQESDAHARHHPDREKGQNPPDPSCARSKEQYGHQDEEGPSQDERYQEPGRQARQDGRQAEQAEAASRLGF